MTELILWLCLLGIVIILALWGFFTRNHIHPDRYDYLDVLSLTEWKSGRQVRQEMEEAYGGSLSYGELYTSMRALIEEGLVEKRDETDGDGRIRYFRRKASGKPVPAEPMASPSAVPA